MHDQHLIALIHCVKISGKEFCALQGLGRASRTGTPSGTSS